MTSDNSSGGELADHRSASSFIGPWKTFAFILGLACSLYYMWVALVGIRYPQLDRSLFIFFGISLALALKPLGQSVLLRLVDLILILLAAAATLRFNSMYEEFLNMAGLPISNIDMAFGLYMTVLCLEACRRALGPAVPILAVIFLAFLRYGSFVPEPFSHVDFGWRTIASYMYAGTDGLYGEITYVLASQMFLFLVFGTVLLHSGASEYFSRAATSLFGNRPGGTAKAAIASSALMGSIMGSAAANSAVTGTVTIPLMKNSGFAANVAGGIEAAASTGGTVLPPVMGVAAFIMVALTGIPYLTIATYSAIPAVLYFLFVYAQVHFYSRRKGIVGLPRADLPPRLTTVVSGWYYFIPLALIIALIFLDFSLAYIALLAIIATIIVSWFDRKTRMGPVGILKALAAGAQNALPIISVAGPVAVISECLLLPGTGLRVTGMIIGAAQGNLGITVFLIFIIAYILGMGLSVVPAYLILATLAAPALIDLHVPVLAAHLLVMWWSQASNITPPVALAVYITSAIAEAPLWSTGWAAVKKGAGFFFLPVLFIYQPGLLLNGQPLQIALTIGSLTVGIVFCAAAIEGFFWRRLMLVPRILLGLGGGTLTFGHDPITVVIGGVIVALGIFISTFVEDTFWRRRVE